MIDVHHGDMREVLAGLPQDKFEACVTDPPYHFGSIVKRFAKSGGGDRPESRVGAYNRHATGFMGKSWDGGDIAFQPETWAAVLRVLKPGAHLLAFGGTKGFHRMAVAIEDAGFELRDTIMWLYGSGFPKSHNQKGEWAGWGTALKPAFEPILMARKPLDGTVAANLAAHRTGAINVDSCRVTSGAPRPLVTSNRRLANNTYGAGLGGSKAEGETDLGRWPANIIHDGSDEVLAAFPDARGQIAASSSSPEKRKTQNVFGAMTQGANVIDPRDEGGSAARFFYCAKASRKDRNEGCEDMPERPLNWSSGDANPGSFQSEGTNKKAQNNHPTVKPTTLMRHLCRLVTPPGGTILDPFMGSGSTGKAAGLEGFSFTGIEREQEYLDIAKRRLGVAGGGFFS